MLEKWASVFVLMSNDLLLSYSGDLGANRPVPFRLTPNIAEFISQTGVTGPLTAAMVSAARCFVQPRFKLGSLLKAILRDEYITWHKKVRHIITLGTWSYLITNTQSSLLFAELLKAFRHTFYDTSPAQ